MRTVTVDSDHQARYERTSKGVYNFTVVHAATDRELGFGSCKVRQGDDVGEGVRAASARLISMEQRKRDRDSRAFVDGRHVPGAPSHDALPPVLGAEAAAGTLDIPAEIPVGIIRSAYQIAAYMCEPPEQHLARRERSALEIGHKVLIGVSDAVILEIATGKATLRGSFRAGVELVRLPGGELAVTL